METYVCQQCRYLGYPDCEYGFHPTPPEGEGLVDRWRVAADTAGRPEKWTGR